MSHLDNSSRDPEAWESFKPTIKPKLGVQEIRDWFEGVERSLIERFASLKGLLTRAPREDQVD